MSVYATTKDKDYLFTVTATLTFQFYVCGCDSDECAEDEANRQLDRHFEDLLQECAVEYDDVEITEAKQVY